MQTSLISRIMAASSLRVQVGGGVRSTDDIRQLLDAGMPELLSVPRRWKTGHGSSRWCTIRLSIAVSSLRWMQRMASSPRADGLRATGKLAVDVARQVSDWPLAGILYTDVAKDGMMTGPNFEQTRRLAEAGKVPVIASGGVGSIEHIRTLTGMPVWGVIVGRSLYEGKVDLKEAIAMAGNA